MKYILIAIITFVAFQTSTVFAQSTTLQWTAIQNLEDSLKATPKNSFIYLYTKNCVYCKKMDQSTFNKEKIKQLLSREFHTVKMNAQQQESVFFLGHTWYNTTTNTSRQPVHELAQYLGSKPKGTFAAPAIIILDKEFNIIGKYHEYISPNKMFDILQGLLSE